MINLIFIFIILILSLFPLNLIYSQQSRDTIILTHIDGNNINVPFGGTTISTSITFTYDDTNPGNPLNTIFQCSLDNGPIETTDCTSGKTITYTGLSVGFHTFDVAVCLVPGSGDPNCDTTPAHWEWFVGSDTFITSAIDGQNNFVANFGTSFSDKISFTFSDNNMNQAIMVDGFECSLDGSAFADCESLTSQSYSSLGPGDHHFEVRSFVLDGANNRV
ncbi:MAG: hypothetical protein ACE5SW_13370, partial [Nitrososphaeraceae archaeon]